VSWAAWWQGDLERTFAARERAHRLHRRAGDVCGAARMAMWLASDHFDFRGDDAVAAAWLRSAEDLLRGHGPCPEQGYNLLMAADIALFAHGDPATATAKASEAIDLARRIDDAGVEVVGNAILGSALVARGDVEEGLGRLDACAAIAVAEDFDLIVAPGWALCHTVSVCANVGDFGRAGQWCRALHAWSERWQGRHFFGRALTPDADFFGATPYADFQCSLDDPPGFRNYWTAENVVDLPDAAIERIAQRGAEIPAGESRFIVHPLMLWKDESDDPRHIEYARVIRTEVQPWSTGATYPNFLGEEGAARMSAAYGASTARLAAVKQRWDPHGVFHTHQALREL
jgi:FAD/FMN-containing dehydrogenase